MNRPRTSVSGLAAVVLVSAIGIGSLRGESPLWAGFLLMLDLAVFAFAILAAIYRDGARRAWWLGFAFFGWGYLAIAFGPWAAESIAPRLATSMLVQPLYARFGPLTERIDLRSGSFAQQQRRLVDLTNEVTAAFEKRRDLTEEQLEILYDLRHMLDPERRSNLEVEQGGLRRRSQLIRSSLKDFEQTAHCLVALMAAYIGGISVRVLHAGSGTGRDGRELPPGAGRLLPK